MKLFLDTSVLLAASGSATGASRELFRLAPTEGWILLATPYVVHEVEQNLPDLPTLWSEDWGRLRPALSIADDVFTLDRPVVFGPAKDRPILFSALAWADVLLTLDRVDFGDLLNNSFYGLAILTPGMFLKQHRRAER